MKASKASMYILNDLFVVAGEQIIDVTSCADKALNIAVEASKGLKEVVVENWRGDVAALCFDGKLIEANDNVLFVGVPVSAETDSFLMAA